MAVRSGWFDVSPIVFDPNGVPARQAVTFEQHCEDRASALHGTLCSHA